MAHDSMSTYFQQELEEGNVPSDPFEDATRRALKALTEEEKEKKRIQWNNQIVMLFGGEEKMRQRMLLRRAKRASHR